MSVKLKPEQLTAVEQMHNGCLLCGGTGAGKSITSIAYYFRLNGGDFVDGYYPMDANPMDLYIITPAKKRNTHEWNMELARFLIAEGDGSAPGAIYEHKVKIDSWNNIKKYRKIKGAFFIFDEDKVTGDGKWADAFVEIAKNNQWILASATPGDRWADYMMFFIANGFYKNRTDFKSQHIVYNPHVPYPDIKGYINTGRLIRLRNRVIVKMEVNRSTVQHHEYIYCGYDKDLYKDIVKNRWNYDKNKPIENASEYCMQLRKVVNENYERVERILELFMDHPRMIIFYNYNYELDILRHAFEFMTYDEEIEDFSLSEWNGQVHQDIPHGDSWVYLVQYNACEAWNCVNTDTIVFYSMNYSYKTMIQAAGRIDRLNTPYKDLYYYHLTSKSGIDMAIMKALSDKKKFNESIFAGFR